MRLFAALPLPPPVLDRLASLRLRLSHPRDGLRWSSPEQWHITLQFFGELSSEQVSALLTELSHCGPVAAPSLELGTLGLFAPKGILLAVVEDDPALQLLQQAVAAAGRRVVPTPAPSLPFRPHVTLARSKGKVGFQSLQRLCSPSLPPFGPVLRWQAPAFRLLESDLTPEGATYRLVHSYALAGEA